MDSRPPVVTVATYDHEEFEAKSADLVREGYKLVAASCNFAYDETYDYKHWQAIFARPWAIGFQPPAHPDKR